MTRTMIFIAASALCLGACASLSRQAAPDYDYLLIETDPPGATLTFPDGTSCETPCPVNVTETMNMKVAKAGYKAQTYRLSSNAPGELMIDLELVAPRTDVEETALPDL